MKGSKHRGQGQFVAKTYIAGMGGLSMRKMLKMVWCLR